MTSSKPNRSHGVSILPLILVFAALLAPPATAGTQSSILAFDGRPVRVFQATYGDLDPLGGETSPRNSVLAVELSAEDGPPQVELVPGTEGSEVEGGFTLFYDKGSEALFIFWESREEGATALHLIGRNGSGEWTEGVEVSGNPFSAKTPPQLAITHEVFVRETGDGEDTPVNRSILHLVWSEKRDDDHALLYSPVALENSSYLGPNAIYDLADLAAVEAGGEAPEPTAWLIESPLVREGEDGHSVVVAFADAGSRHLVTLEVETLSDELVTLADIARADITVLGHRPTLRAVMDVARADITVLGHRIHPGMRGFMARTIEDSLVAAGGAASLDASLDAGVAADLVWREIIRSGASVGDQGLLDSSDGSTASLLEAVAREAGEERRVGEPLLQMRRIAQLPVPATGDAPTRIFVSPDGTELIVSWRLEDRVMFRESGAGGWSEAQSLELGTELSLAQAYSLLEERVR